MTSAYQKYGRENVRLILSSSWRADYDCHGNYNDSFQKYLERELLVYGITLDGVTPHLAGRAFEIVSYLADYKGKLDGYVLFDDQDYGDMKTYLCSKHWVQTAYQPKNPPNGKGGLQPYHIKHVLAMLEKPITAKERVVLDYVYSLAK